MAVKVINGGTFTKEVGDRPGLYVRWINMTAGERREGGGGSPDSSVQPIGSAIIGSTFIIQ